jgi:hypothetical protein
VESWVCWVLELVIRTISLPTRDSKDSRVKSDARPNPIWKLRDCGTSTTKLSR